MSGVFCVFIYFFLSACYSIVPIFAVLGTHIGSAFSSVRGLQGVRDFDFDQVDFYFIGLLIYILFTLCFCMDLFC